MFQVARAPQVFDVVVVGSGAGGGTALKVLTDAGIRVALCEAGPRLTPEKDFKEHVWPYQVDHRGAGPNAEAYFGRQQWGYFSAPNGYWDVPGDPYFKPEDGLSDPWPVTYDEISPYYDKAEGFIGITGTKEGLRTAPDGNF